MGPQGTHAYTLLEQLFASHRFGDIVSRGFIDLRGKPAGSKTIILSSEIAIRSLLRGLNRGKATFECIEIDFYRLAIE